MNISQVGQSGFLTSNLPQQDGLNSDAKSTKSPIVDQSVKAAGVQDKRQQALSIVNKTLTMAYEKISSRGKDVSAEYDRFEPLTAEKVANNILGFIERRLQLDKAEGASAEDLQARLEAGLSGFKKGFAEASEKLKALSLLAPEIEADIGNTYDRVIKGVEDLRAKFISDLTSNSSPQAQSKADSTLVAPLKTYTSTSKATTKIDDLHLPQLNLGRSSATNVKYEYARAREFSFELTTKEGDKVVIRAASSEGFALETTQRPGAAVNRAQGSYSASESMNFQVEGDLNESELRAINELLGRVNDLAGQFFDGNLDSAFELALGLGYDEAQIGGFSLNLAQVELRQTSQAYQAYTPDNALLNDEQNFLQLSQQYLPMGNFIKNLLDSLDSAQDFSKPQELLTDVARQLPDEPAQGERLAQFMHEIFALKLA